MYTKEQISEEIKRVAEKLNVTALSEKDFKQNSTLPLSTIRYYMGSWSRALKEASLDAASDKRADNAPRDDDELLMELLRLYNRYGETPTVSLVNEKGKFAYRYYGSRWKSLNEAFLLAKAKFPKKNVSMPQKTADKKVEEFPGLDPLPQTPVTNAADINIMPGEPNRDVDSMKPGNLNNMDTIHTMDTIDTKLDTMNPMGSMNTLETMDTMEAIDSLETLGMPDIPGTLEVPGIDPADALEVPEIDSTGAVDVLSEVPGSTDSANVHDGDFQPTHIFLDEQEGKIAGEKQTAQTENKLKKMTEEFVADEDEETLSEIEPKDIIRRMMTPKPKTGEFSSNDVDLGDTIPTAPVNPADFSSNDVDLGDTMPTAAVNPGEFSSNDVDLGDTMPTAPVNPADFSDIGIMKNTEPEKAYNPGPELANKIKEEKSKSARFEKTVEIKKQTVKIEEPQQNLPKIPAIEKNSTPIKKNTIKPTAKPYKNSAAGFGKGGPSMTGNQKIKLIPKTIKPKIARIKRKVVGEPIQFRGLRYAPLNRLGVAYMFGLVAHELGFIIESLRNESPDCDGKRCLDTNHDQWEQVKIDFHYKSSDFQQGFHDNLSDIVVCWTHDWEDCPIEVLELRSIINLL